MRWTRRNRVLETKVDEPRIPEWRLLLKTLSDHLIAQKTLLFKVCQTFISIKISSIKAVHIVYKPLEFV